MSGYQLMIAGDVVRARYLKSIERPAPIVADAVNEVMQIVFPANDHVFRAGHRSWFGAEHLVSGHRSESAAIRAEHFRRVRCGFSSATQRIYRSERRASHIALPVVSREYAR